MDYVSVEALSVVFNLPWRHPNGHGALTRRG